MQRREFCKRVGLSGLALGVSPLMPWDSANAKNERRRGNRVAILGGGVAGLSAAHELLERGFQVSVYETRQEAGGKARSVYVPNTSRGGRRDLPGEHGFRFYPAFYYHLWDTMSRIPFKNKSVINNMVPIERITFSVKEKRDIPLVSRIPQSEKDFILMYQEMFTPKFGIPRKELEDFAKRMVVFLTSCEERRLGEYEKMPWMEFVDGYNKSENFRRFIATGLTRNVVAAKGDKVSARTVAAIGFQLTQGLWSSKGSFGFFLDGPTTEVWIAPWMKYMETLGLEYHGNARCVGFDVTEGEITSAKVVEEGIEKDIQADWYISALPAEVMAGLIDTKMRAFDPQLSRIKDIVVDWMVGMQFYFDQPLTLGHVGPMNYVDSPWALTSITQSNIWRYRLANYGDGSVKGLLSVDISNWNAPGILYNKTAKECSLEEIKSEVMAQILMHIDGSDRDNFLRANLVHCHLDPGIQFQDGGVRNDDPLLINTPDSWKNRPEAWTSIYNLFLASDYVRSYSDLACMEAANEAARRAVNALLKHGHYQIRPCAIRPLKEPRFFALGKQADRLRYAMGLPHPGMKT